LYSNLSDIFKVIPKQSLITFIKEILPVCQILVRYNIFVLKVPLSMNKPTNPLLKGMIRPQKLKLLIRNSYTIAFRWYNCRWPWRYFKVI